MLKISAEITKVRQLRFDKEKCLAPDFEKLSITAGDKFRDDYSRALIYLSTKYLSQQKEVNTGAAVICVADLPNIDAICRFLQLYLSDQLISSQAFPEATVTSGSTTVNRILKAQGGNYTISNGGCFVDALFVAALEAQFRGNVCHLFFGDVSHLSVSDSYDQCITHIVIRPASNKFLYFHTNIHSSMDKGFDLDVSEQQILSELVLGKSGHYHDVSEGKNEALISQ